MKEQKAFKKSVTFASWAFEWDEYGQVGVLRNSSGEGGEGAEVYVMKHE